MEAEENKENYKIEIRMTKIPLPKKPLPPMPTRLTDIDKKYRRPLKTLNFQATSSHMIDKIDKKSNFKESTEWDNKIFRDEYDRKIKEREPQCKVDSVGVVECDLLNLDELRPNTPHVSAGIEAPRIRNIKRSLKRPHSRELQKRSPGCRQYKSEYNIDVKLKPYNLGEIINRLEKPDKLTNQYVQVLNVYSVDIFKNMLQNECKLTTPSMLNEASRTCIVNWILKINGEDGDPSISQTACILLDNFSSKYMVIVESVQVMGAACFWIAQKMKGPNYAARRMVGHGSLSYDVRALVNAEKKILKYLNFPNQPVLPHDFTTYLSWWCDYQNPGPIEVASSFIILCGYLMDKSFACVFPSVLGCAAIFNAIVLLDRRELIPRLLSSEIYIAAQEKTDNFMDVCKNLRSAVIAIGVPCNKYRAPYDHYSRPPLNIAQLILDAVLEYEYKKFL